MVRIVKTNLEMINGYNARVDILNNDRTLVSLPELSLMVCEPNYDKAIEQFKNSLNILTKVRKERKVS